MVEYIMYTVSIRSVCAATQGGVNVVVTMGGLNRRAGRWPMKVS